MQEWLKELDQWRDRLNELGLVIGAKAQAIEDQAAMLVALRALKDDVGALADAVQANIAKAMPKKHLIVPGIGTLERKPGTLRKAWDHERIGSVIALHGSCNDDGEVLDAQNAAERTKTLLLEAAGISYWRVGVLRKRHQLDPDKVCQVESGRPSVIIHT